MTSRRFFFSRFVALLLGTVLFVSACQPQSNTPETSPASDPAATSSPQPATEQVLLNGAGASFPLYLYQRWFIEYKNDHPNVQVNYQATGSAAGIQQFVSETLDFGASDIAMDDETAAKVKPGVVMLPMTAGSVAIAYNLPGVESGLRLSRDVYPAIFLGEIQLWNDPKIAALNPDVELPELPIIVVRRSDGSGTTATLTANLSTVNETWKDQIGTGLNVSWPAGIGIKSNAGVSAQIQQAEGAIGYVEYSYAKQLGMPVAALENKAGEFVEPSTESAAIALSSVTFPDNLRAFVPDPDGEGAYPIVTYSWILAYQQYDDATKAAALKDVLQWAVTTGQSFSEEQGYVPLPAEVVERVSAAIDTIGS